jgi:ribulose-phosphate 3-epimerase
MIVNPEKYVERFAKAGASMISFHYEAARENSGLVLRQIRDLGVKAGLVINPDCPVEAIFPYLEELDFVLIMSVFAGFGGQRFMADMMPKLRTLRGWIDERGLAAELEVDGGVDAETAPVCIENGATVLVAGSAVFKAADRAAAIAALRGEKL